MIADLATTAHLSTRSPTNRARKGASLAPRPVTGIDTIKVRGRITEHNFKTVRVTQQVVADTGEVTLVHPFGEQRLPGGPMLRLVSQGGEPFATVEFSAPRFCRGHNAQPATTDEVLAAVSEVREQASGWVAWCPTVEALEVFRLDVVRDFHGVGSPSDLLNALDYVPAQRRVVSQRYSDPVRGGAETLRRGTKGRFAATLYDKHAEVAQAARRAEAKQQAHAVDLLAALPGVRGQVRFEASLRRPVLLEKGLRTMSDIVSTDLDAIARDKFEQMGYDKPVGGQSHLFRVLAALQGTPEYKDVPGVLGYLFCTAGGLTEPHRDPRTARRYRRLASDWGLSPADVALTPSSMLGLDFTTGTMVAA